jgi:hypothetical protein
MKVYKVWFFFTVRTQIVFLNLGKQKSHPYKPTDVK